MSYNYLFKYIIVGNSAVGKSSILMKYINGAFSDTHEMTIGVEFGTKKIIINDNIIKLQIWDTAGQEAYRSITRSYYRDSAGVILVFDITQRRTFEVLDLWLQDVKSMSKTPYIILVGNKIDLASRREVSREEAENYAMTNNMIYIETSAKKYEDINQIFDSLTQTICHEIANHKIDPNNRSNGIKVGEGNPQISQNKSCCGM